jgi:hypothetical protein
MIPKSARRISDKITLKQKKLTAKKTRIQSIVEA